MALTRQNYGILILFCHFLFFPIMSTLSELLSILMVTVKESTVILLLRFKHTLKTS